MNNADDKAEVMEDSPLLGEEYERGEASRESCVEREPRSCLKNLALANVVVCVFTVASNLYNPVLSQYVYHRVSVEVFGNDTRAENFSTLAPCFQNTSDEGYVLQEKAQITSSQQLLQLTVVYSAIAVVSNIFLGTYSDFLGRKFLYVTCIAGYLVQTVVTVVVIHWNLDLEYLYIASVLYGLTGARWSFVLVSCAYTADNTPPRQSRSLWIAVTETITGISYGVSSLAAGYFIQSTGYFYPCLTAVIIYAIAIAIVILCMEETCPRQQTCISPLAGISNILNVYISKDTYMRSVLACLGLLIFFFSIINNSGASNLDTLFEMNLPFCWSPEKIGWFNTITYLVKNLLGVFLVKGLQYCMTDEMVATLASVSALGGDVVWGFATTDWMLYAGVPVIGLVGFAATPLIRGIMSKMSPSDKQGALFASMAVVESACSTFGTPLFNKVYQGTVTYWKGAVYIVMGGMHAAALLLFIVFIPLFRREERRHTEKTVHVQTK